MGLGHEKKDELDRTAAMLGRLGGRGYQVREEQAAYSVDFDPDSDFDAEEENIPPNGCTGRSFFAPVILGDRAFRLAPERGV